MKALLVWHNIKLVGQVGYNCMLLQPHTKIVRTSHYYILLYKQWLFTQTCYSNRAVNVLPGGCVVGLDVGGVVGEVAVALPNK